MLTGKEDGTVIFNARITEDGYVAVTGLFYIGGKKIHISGDTVKIDDVTSADHKRNEYSR